MDEVDVRFSTGGLQHIPVDVEMMRRTIDRALVLRSSQLDRAELEELEELLRGHIEVILPEALERTERLWHGSREWYLARSTLGTIAHSVRLGLGDGLLANYAHVTRLARDCQWILRGHTDRECP
ncbi:DUF6415 family natural product biosynthesis protein [Streptomyces noursei]|uniref:DUF6415 family natural product biosynthesis protein n=1 Tax=Streptomyces noursei TaxID=1971 RepID=UPI001675502B|nr:DUF6415 family natural product biosynthesis protein [Streptomyces noursei]MCZ1013925.1 DUF6415 family natural product biosynthesis protein [Streptomyces noursei]